MQIKDPHKFFGLNTDDNPSQLPEGDYPFAKNVRTQGSDEQHGAGPAETLQSEIPVPLNPDAAIIYYGEAIGNDFIYSGFAEVVIGGQTWMKKNYDADYPGSKIYSETDTGTDEEANLNVYGRMYTHDQIMSADFCPQGWHVPTEADWDVLIAYLGGSAVAGGKMKNVGTALFESPNTGATDEVGFRVVPGGKFDADFELLGLNGLLWVADNGCPLAPVVLNASEITHESFVANWKASDGAAGYYLDVSESPVFASFMMGYEDKDVGNVLTSLVEDLEAFTTYYFRLRSYTDVCLSDNSVTGLAKTLSSLKDLDGNIYIAKTIGTQQWIDRNFKCTKYANGDAIPYVTDNDEWSGTSEVTTIKYGYLYNWYATVDARNIANTGWHVPTDDELYNTDVECLQLNVPVTGDLKETGTTHWNSPNSGATNIYGFNARPNGMRWSNGSFLWLGSRFSMRDCTVPSNIAGFLVNSDIWYALGNIGKEGSGIRLIKDDDINTGTYIGNDGKVYPTVKIGNQVWLAQNLAETKFRNGNLITKVTDNTAWAALTTEGYCAYNNDETNAFNTTPAMPATDAYCWYDNDSATYKEIYGALYNWYAVNHASELAYLEREGVEEVGWRVATWVDYMYMISVIGGAAITGAVLKEVSTDRWGAGHNGIDSVGFSAVPAGLRDATGDFVSILERNDFWTATQKDALMAAYLYITDAQAIYSGSGEKTIGKSVRLVRDLTTPPIDRSQIGDVEFRIMVRNGTLNWDKAITGLGFNGVEDQDWINIKSISNG